MKEGFKKGKRHHVHLSPEIQTAKAVGSRYGKPIVLSIDAKQMNEDGRAFYLSPNVVWLTLFVLPQYIKFNTGNDSGGLCFQCL